jgi:hypothetical protein
MVGECYQFTGKDGNGDENRYEVCGYKSVRQTIVKNGHSYSTGYWARWQTVQEDGKTKYTAHLYNDGESCGPVRRQTAVVFECDPKLKGPKLLSATEPAMCAYELRMALPQWCEIEKMVRAHAGRGAGVARNPALLVCALAVYRREVSQLTPPPPHLFLLSYLTFSSFLSRSQYFCRVPSSHFFRVWLGSTCLSPPPQKRRLNHFSLQ